MPTFDFVDLPGIQSVPEEDRLQTEELVKSYIEDPNTLVLCVLAATDAALDLGAALKLLIDANKLDSTILALTKSDWVHEDNLEDHIFNRILLESETSPAHLLGLKGCVAVVNRSQKDKLRWSKQLRKSSDSLQRCCMRLKGGTRNQQCSIS